MATLQGQSDEHKYFQGTRSINIDGVPYVAGPADTHIIVPKKQRDKLERIRSRSESGEFSFHNIGGISALNMVDDKHCGYLLALSAYLGYQDGVVCNPNAKRTPMTKDDVMRVLDISKKTFYEFIGTMRERGVIRDVVVKGTPTFQIYDRYILRGKSYRGQTMIKSFHEQVRHLYNCNTAKDLGFVYKLLPYVHYSTNFLAHNPDEDDLDKLRTINRSELAELMRIDEKTLTKKMQRLKLDGMPVFACIRVADGNAEYMVNPKIFYRMDGAPSDVLLAIFRDRVERAKRTSECKK